MLDSGRTNNVVEIGWRPVTGEPVLVGSTGMAYVRVAVDRETNNPSAHQKCFLGWNCKRNEFTQFYRERKKANGVIVREVYVVAMDVKDPAPHRQYFAMRWAPIYRLGF
jgi:hypothetical protein